MLNWLKKLNGLLNYGCLEFGLLLKMYSSLKFRYMILPFIQSFCQKYFSTDVIAIQKFYTARPLNKLIPIQLKRKKTSQRNQLHFQREITGKRKWFRITQQMQEKFKKYNFNPKQLGQYWSNNLRNKNINPVWTKEEDLILLNELIVQKRNWARIREKIPSKTPLYIKNRFHKIQKAIDKFYSVQFKQSSYSQEEWEKVLNIYIKIINEQPDEISEKLNFYFCKGKRTITNKEESTQQQQELKAEQINIKQELKEQLEQDKELYERIIQEKLQNQYCLFSPNNLDIQNYMRILMEKGEVKVEEEQSLNNQVNYNNSMLGIMTQCTPIPFHNPFLQRKQFNSEQDESKKNEIMYVSQQQVSENQLQSAFVSSCSFNDNQLFTPQSVLLQNGGIPMLQNEIQFQKQKFTWSQEEIEKEIQRNSNNSQQSKLIDNQYFKSLQNESLKQSLQLQKHLLLEQLADCFIKKEIIQTKIENDQ